MELNLKRPIAFFDLETTGLNTSHDRIVEISVLKINVNGEEEQREWLLNPEIPISAESTSVHGYTNEMVADKPTFREKAKEIAQFLGNADLAGYNILKFDLPLLVEEFLRVDYDFDLKDRGFIDVMNIFMKMEPRTLKGAYRFFCHGELEGAHGAIADTRATYDVLRAMLDRYQGVDYEDAKPYYTLVYVGKNGVQNIWDLWVEIHSVPEQKSEEEERMVDITALLTDLATEQEARDLVTADMKALEDN